MKRIAHGLRRALVLLALLIVGMVGLTSPSWATTVTTCGGICFSVDGSGNHIARAGASLNSDYRHYNFTRGHLQVRWHAGGADHFKNGNETIYNNQGTVWVPLNVTVDPNTYVCGRLWHWTGSAWVLPYGDWRCVKTHP